MSVETLVWNKLENHGKYSQMPQNSGKIGLEIQEFSKGREMTGPDES